MPTSRRKHPNAEVEKAVRYAEDLGWRVSLGSGHNWARLLCPLGTREGCQVGVYSTPANAGNHARQIRNAIDRCTHRRDDEQEAQEQEA